MRSIGESRLAVLSLRAAPDELKIGATTGFRYISNFRTSAGKKYSIAETATQLEKRELEVAIASVPLSGILRNHSALVFTKRSAEKALVKLYSQDLGAVSEPVSVDHVFMDAIWHVPVG